jgi:DNA polymerase bacteriophage-type
MRPVVADLESFYDPKNLRGDRKPDGSPDPYTLKSMTTEAYCRDKRFEMHGIAIKWDAATNPVWYDEREFRYVAKEEDWSDVFLISHHANFDHLVLSHHYGVHPRMSGCTMSMARLMLGNHIGVSLDSVRSQFGISAKTTPYGLMEGRHWSDMDQNTRQLVADGAIDEVNSIWRIFGILMQQGFPVEELDVIDSTVKMFSEPELLGDNAIFAKVWQDEAVRKQALLERLGVTKEDLGSNERFISLLLARGVEPEYKPGKPNPDGSEKLIPAFAKTDPFMEELQQHEDDEVRALAEARLGTKSTLLQTRAETLGWMASRGSLCVYLRYCGAHTSRWSGGDDTNFQNWTNGSEINSAVVAPDGYLIAEPDASQIECRLLNFCAGQWDKVQEFRSGADPYVGVASAFYKKSINKKDHPLERQLGKIVELQAGYGSGGNKIRSTVRVKSFGKIILTPAEGVEARDAYRSTHPQVVIYWRQAENYLSDMGRFRSGDWGPFRIRCDAAKGTRRIILPNGIELKYDTLEFYSDPDDGDRYWRLKTRKGWVKLYGAKLVENIIQALARVVVSQAMLRLKKLGYRTKNTKHDSLWLLIPKDGRLDKHKETILREMSRELPWLPGCPLAAELKGEPSERITW